MPKQELDRREFIKRASLGALGTGLSAVGFKRASALQNFWGDSEKILDMKYRRLGRTEMMVSEISLGGTSIATIINASMDNGVNYVDTAACYGNGMSEREIGRAVKGRRKDIYIATKWHTERKNITKEKLLASLEGSLKRLATDYVDVIMVHGVASEWQITTPALFEAFEQAKRDGKARFLGASSHDGMRVKWLSQAIESGKFDVILVSFNYSNYEADDHNLLKLAQKYDVGVVCMKAQQNKAEVHGITDGKGSIRQANLKWVLSKDIATVISSLWTFELMEEDIAASGKKLTKADSDMLEKYAQAISKDYCRGCRQNCESACPQSIAIANIMRYSMYYRHYREQDRAREFYHNLTAEQTFANCTLCGVCDKKCVFGIPVMDKLRQAHTLMA